MYIYTYLYIFIYIYICPAHTYIYLHTHVFQWEKKHEGVPTRPRAKKKPLTKPFHTSDWSMSLKYVPKKTRCFP